MRFCRTHVAIYRSYATKLHHVYWALMLNILQIGNLIVNKPAQSVHVADPIISAMLLWCDHVMLLLNSYMYVM